MNSTQNPQVVNPFSTANGGVTFEQLVATSYLVSLLAGHIPRGLDCIIKEVKFQTKWSQCLLDDIVVIGTDNNAERKLALQIKHDMTFSASDSTFERIIAECWKTFIGSSGWQFNKDTDRLGIGIGVYQTKVARHFQSLLEWARTSKNADEFLNKISVPYFSSKKKREYIEIIKILLNKAKGSDVTNNELWQFLRCLVVIHFDLEYLGSRDSVQCWNCLLDQLKTRDSGQAKTLFNDLTSIVAKYACSAGSLDSKDLRKKVSSSVNLKDHPNFVSDLNHLKNRSNTVLESIRDTIGEKVHLSRFELTDELEAAIKENEAVVITGEPMVGKSVLLKLLANRLRSEGEIIVFSVDRLFGAALENFLHNINVKNDFQDILSAVGNAPLRCILIDGLERVLIDEDKKRILNDLIIAIRKYNESVLSNGGHKEYCWKIVFACRSLEAENILLNMKTRKNIVNNSLKKIEVGSLTVEEIAEVVDHFPKLEALVSQKHLKEILSRPLILDILTLPGISLSPEQVPPILTESWLLKWFWKQVIRLDEGVRSGKGNPDKREQQLIYIGEQSLHGEKFVRINNDMDMEAISGLVSDNLLDREDNKLRFAHDVIEDWTFAIILGQKDNVPEFLKQSNESLQLARAFRLYVSKFLEVEQSPNAWLDILSALEKENTLSPRWYQYALTAPLFSPMIKELLPLIKPYLFENNAILFNKFLKALRTICIQPDLKTYLIFGDLPQKEFEKYLAYTNIPLWEQWIPVIQMVLQNTDKLSDECFFEFSFISKNWMTKTKGDQLFRKEITKLSLTLLNKRFTRKNSESNLEYEKKKKIRENFIESILFAADCFPDQVDNFVKQAILKNKNPDVNELVLKKGWIPLCKYLPKTAIDILERILCWKLEPDRHGSYHFLFMNLGIKSTGWNPPTHLKGPFLVFLRLHPDEGLCLINKVINHATQCWKIREELNHGKEPLPQTVRLGSGPIEVWGDELVYYWFRYLSMAPDTIICALMALEFWMNERIKNDEDPQELFERVLKNTKSVAVVGVCCSVALANYKNCCEVIVPILENPAFWAMDLYRYTQDRNAESSTRMFSNYFSFRHEKSDYKILLDFAKESHRRLHIQNLIPLILLHGSKKACNRLQSAMRTFPDNLYFFFENEKKNENLIQERKETCKIWASQAKLENYEMIKEEDEKAVGFQFKLPEELEIQQKEKLDALKKRGVLYSLLGWVMNFLDKNEISQAFTIESAMRYVQHLICQDDPSYQPKKSIEDSELRAQGIAAFAAALVIRRWSWIEKNNYISWCREQLLIAARRPRPSPIIHEEVFPQGYKRSAALALPILLSKYPEDREIRKAIFTLALHEINEVREYLFGGLKVLWSLDQETIWECIALAIKASREKAHELRFMYQRTTLKKHVHSFSIKLFSKNFRDYSPEEIDIHYLESMLYCLPSGIQITQIELKDRLINFLEDLLYFTITANIYYQDKDFNPMEGFLNKWNDLLFQIIANSLLYLPQNVTKPKFYTPVMENWEKVPKIMEKLLWHLLLIGSQPQLEDRLVQLWPSIGIDILSSDYCKGLKYHRGSEIRNILCLLIFTNPGVSLTWDIQEQTLRKMVPFIKKWCDTVGHRSDCFSSLVKFLKNIGFFLVPEYGINWLYDCISRGNNRTNLFERSRISTSFAELLNDSWLTYRVLLKQNPETFRRFNFLVDILVEQGESLAVQLQSNISADSQCNEQ